MTRRLSATCYVQEPADSIEQAKQGQPREEQVLTRMRLPECPELETVLGSGSASKVWGGVELKDLACRGLLPKLQASNAKAENLFPDLFRSL